eukprot:scaffold18599_cov27-Attheya_sp.AAC.2
MRKRTALELAIEAGDWDKVGEAAVELDDLSYNGSEMMTVAAVKDLRASELDKMIGKVLWQRWDNSMNWEDPLRVVHLVLRLLLEERKRRLLGHSDTDGEGSCAAADWVFARSLSALQRVERKIRVNSPKDHHKRRVVIIHIVIIIIVTTKAESMEQNHHFHRVLLMLLL